MFLIKPVNFELKNFLILYQKKKKNKKKKIPKNEEYHLYD